MSDLNDLKQAVEKAQQEEKKIKLLVLQILHLNGIMAFDASDVLDENIEQLIMGSDE